MTIYNNKLKLRKLDYELLQDNSHDKTNKTARYKNNIVLF